VITGRVNIHSRGRIAVTLLSDSTMIQVRFSQAGLVDAKDAALAVKIALAGANASLLTFSSSASESPDSLPGRRKIGLWGFADVLQSLNSVQRGDDLAKGKLGGHIYCWKIEDERASRERSGLV
jgi:hypothetical protein